MPQKNVQSPGKPMRLKSFSKRIAAWRLALAGLGIALSLGWSQLGDAQLPAETGASGEGTMTAQAMWALKRVGPPMLSPDGRVALVNISHYDLASDRRSSDFWLYPMDGGSPRQITADPGNEGEGAFSPDGRFLAFVARRHDDRAPQLYILPLSGGEARRLTSVPTGVSIPKWLPNGKGVVFLSRIWPDLKDWEAQGKRLREREDSKMTAMAWDKPPISYFDHYLDDRENHLFSVDLASAEVKGLTSGSGIAVFHVDQGPDPYDVAPDGAAIALTVNSDKSGVRPNIDLVELSLSDRSVRNVTKDNAVGSDNAPLYSPDGKFLAYTQRSLYGFYGENAKLIIYDRATGTRRDITAGWDRSASDLVWADDSLSLYGSIDDASVHRVYRFDAKGRQRPERITNGPADIATLDVAGQPMVMAGLRQSMREPPTLVRIDPKTGKTVPLSHVNDAALATTQLGRYESVTYKGAGGDDVQMWVIYPPDFDPAKKYPSLMLIHGGPHNATTDAWSWRWNAQVFASWGYVVTWHNFHGSSGFGQAFTDSINPEWGEAPYQDTIKAAEWLAARPFIDKSRMAAGGGSYGGYLASFILGREHPFKTLIVHAGVYNLYTQIAADFAGAQPRFPSYWQEGSALLRNSPHMQAARFNTPTLILHGQLDLRVPVNHGIELFNTLQHRGIPSRFVYFPQENHWILKPQDSIYWYDEVRRWLQIYVPTGAQP
jgi:dipeptidyl aminopeptidase/acylaminoacyl peptidase